MDIYMSIYIYIYVHVVFKIFCRLYTTIPLTVSRKDGPYQYVNTYICHMKI